MIFVSVWFVTGRITRPIRKLDRAMTRVASGHLDTRITVRSDDEVGKLAKRFSEMTSQLVLREQAERKARKTSFDRIVQGLSGHYYYYSHDIDGVVKYVSPSVQDVLGLTPEEYSQHYTKFYTDTPENQNAINETQRVINKGVSGIYEVEMYGGGGAVHHIEMVKVPVYDFEGKIIGVEGMGRDITDRVSDTARFRGLLESAPDAVVITDGDGVITVVNAQTEALLGYVRSSLVGQPVSCLFPEKECASQPLLNNPSLELLKSQAGSTIELRARKSSGHTLPVEMAFSPIETPEGLLISISLRDVSDRHAAERALRLSEERYRRIIEGLQQECIFYTQRVDGTFVYVTESVEQILGYTPEEFMAGPEAYLHRDIDREKIAQVRKELSKGNTHPGYELELVRADGSVCVMEVLDTPAFNERGQVTAIEGLARDKTAEKTAARALAEARDQAEAANKAKSLFLSNMSHELRTPLNGVLGYAQLLLGDREVTPSQHERLMAVQTCGQHLLTLINDILDLTKIEAGEMELHYEVTSLTILVETVEQILYQKAEKAGLKLELTIRPDVPRCVYADETKLRQILINLVGNAIKFTESGHVDLTVFMVGNELAFEVLDTGIGITEDHLEHIFEPFRQGEAGRREGGTGLGLSISRRLATTMGGNLTVISKPGKGSCFTLTLPLKSAEGDRYCPIVKTLAEDTFEHLAPGQKIQVMVVDDSTTNRDILKQMLEAAGLNVLSVGSGREAITLGQRYCIDLVLMDLRMSGMSGFRAAHTMKARLGNKCPPIVAISAGVYPSLPDIIKRWGFVDFIGKPFRVHELFQVIRRHLNAVWVHAESHRPTPPPDALPALSREQASMLVGQLAEAMEMGDVEAVRAAAVGLTDKDQAIAFWANRILEYCDSLALDQLEEMMSQLMGLCESAVV
nr:PAS domain S-box protein [Sansalvadorimonas sp. 2012CJ34-2]